MASLNKSVRADTTYTLNRSGHTAFRMDERTKLVTMALTTMLGEFKYYGDNTPELILIAQHLCDTGEGEFVAKLAVWARTEGNMRSVSHALAAVVAHGCPGKPFVRPAMRRIASMRGDDGTEIVAAYLALYGKPIPNALRRGVADALGTMSAYSLAKYQSGSREVKLRDVLRLCHPTPRDDEAAEAMRACIDGTLAKPKSWETELSERGNTAEVWNELVSEHRIGYMAMLRNLRNMLLVRANVRPVIETLMDPDAVRASRQLPFRFYSAWREINSLENVPEEVFWRSKYVMKGLERAIAISCENADRLPGRTAVLIDSSGSMSWSVSTHSRVSCHDIASLLGAMVVHLSDEVWACIFSDDATPITFGGKNILEDAQSVPYEGSKTNMAAAFELLSSSGFDADRVIVLSDYEVNTWNWGAGISKKVFGNHGVIQRWLEAYREQVGHDVWCHAIDLQGYGTQQFIGPKTNVIAGWSDAVLRFIAITEKGTGSLVEEICALELA